MLTVILTVPLRRAVSLLPSWVHRVVMLPMALQTLPRTAVRRAATQTAPSPRALRSLVKFVVTIRNGCNTYTDLVLSPLQLGAQGGHASHGSNQSGAETSSNDSGVSCFQDQLMNP